MSEYEVALRINPNNTRAHYNLGIELAQAGKLDAAAFHFFEALKRNPKSEKLHNNLGVILAQQGKLDAAIEHFQRAIQINPEYPRPYVNYGMTQQALGQTGPAVTNYLKALSLDPDLPEAMDKLAVLYATCREPEWRNVPAAVRLAERANQITRYEMAAYLDSLAVVYASAGMFSNAVATAEAAQQKAQAAGLKQLASKLEANLASYRSGKCPQPAAEGPSAYGIQR